MKKFSELNIKPKKTDAFVGKTIDMLDYLNRDIIVQDYRIEDTKIESMKLKGNGKCLHLQISIDNEQRVIFTSSTFLQDAIVQIDKSNFPFATKIIRGPNNSLKFS